MSIKETLATLEQQVNEAYDHYLELHKKLAEYAHKPLTDEMVEPVNILLKDIQNTFADIYPFFHFVNYRYQHACNAVEEYNTFIENLKKNGAKEVKEN